MYDTFVDYEKDYNVPAYTYTIKKFIKGWKKKVSRNFQ